jgi:Tol biopolymer transport system component
MRSGVQGVWISNEDGSNMVQISNPDYASGSPQWSPDGKKIAFDSSSGNHWQVYVADVAERKPRKLLTNIFPSIRPSWSRDGKWIYFAGDGRGIYRCPASGGDATALSKDLHALDPRESFDGKMVYFSVPFEAGAKLKGVAATGPLGTESEVDGSLRVTSWTVTAGGIYFVPVDAPTSVRYFEFASKRIRTIFDGQNLFDSGLSISPDGRWILYSQDAGEAGDIMLVDHFR